MDGHLDLRTGKRPDDMEKAELVESLRYALAEIDRIQKILSKSPRDWMSYIQQIKPAVKIK